MQVKHILLFGLLFMFVGWMGCESESKHAANPLDGTWIDLTYAFSDETLYWPTSALFQMDTVAVGYMEGGFYYESYQVATAEHGGTHLDAPVHFSEGKQSTEQIPLDRLIGPASVVDVSAQAAADRDYLVTTADIIAWEASHGELPDGNILLIRTGYGAHWPDAEKYLGTALRGAEGVANLHFPGLHPDAAQWLVDNRNISALGIDTASIDYGQSTTYSSHVALFAANIPAFENVANMDQLPATGAHVVALPMKIKGGSGGPLRIIARLP
ncbi:MAG: cyclase family protein [Bacteroidota bacterium]